MSGDRDKQFVRVARINGNLRNLLAIAQSEMRPSFSRISGLVNAIANGEIGPLQSFTAADINNVWIGKSNSHSSNRAGWLLIEDGSPSGPVIGGLPHATVANADVKDIRLARDA